MTKVKKNTGAPKLFPTEEGFEMLRWGEVRGKEGERQMTSKGGEEGWVRYPVLFKRWIPYLYFLLLHRDCNYLKQTCCYCEG